jgi:hypothetical protein
VAGMTGSPAPLVRCCLGEAELQAQVERYRETGRSAVTIERGPRRIELRLDRSVDPALVEELLAVERGCCPFFELEWEPDARRLAVSVGDGEHEGALAAVAAALGLDEPR